MTRVDWCAPSNQQPTNGTANGLSSNHSQKYKDRKQPLEVGSVRLGFQGQKLLGPVDTEIKVTNLQIVRNSYFPSTQLPFQKAWIFGTPLWEPRILQISERWELYWTFPITETDYYRIRKICGDYREVAIIWLTGLAFDLKYTHA